MEFTLFYKGRLTAERKNSRVEKQTLRRHFHLQLRELWHQPPLDAAQQMWNPKAMHYKSEGDIRLPAGAFEIVPLCAEHTYLVADLEIDMLRPGPYGLNRSHAGDIDNRLKILLDSLRMPLHTRELPDGDAPAAGEVPFFCLLEDDSLIHDLTIRTHRWLEPNVPPDTVQLLIKVRTLVTRDIMFHTFGSWMV
jgi:hypothetical protein